MVQVVEKEGALEGGGGDSSIIPGTRFPSGKCLVGVAQEQNPIIQHLTPCGQIRCTWW